MKQPRNIIKTGETPSFYYIRVVQNMFGCDIVSNIAYGKTKQSALKAAIRRLERLKRNCEKMLEDEK